MGALCLVVGPGIPPLRWERRCESEAIHFIAVFRQPAVPCRDSRREWGTRQSRRFTHGRRLCYLRFRI